MKPKNTSTPAEQSDAALRGRQLLDLRAPDSLATVDAFGVKTPLDPKLGLMLDTARSTANEMSLRAEDGC